MFTLGDFKIHLINDAFTLVDAGGVFGLVPRVLWRDLIAPDPENRVPMAYHALLVQTGTQTILIDTGWGNQVPEKQQQFMEMNRAQGGVMGALARIGVAPEQVDLVIDTHLHADHAGGNMRLSADGALVPAFPNAEYVVQRREHQDASHPNERTRATYLSENFEPLLKTGQMRLLDGDTDLAPGIRGVCTPGHTPGHMSVIVQSGGESLLFVCDLASYAVHFERLGWMTAYDLEPVVTLETKRIWQKWASENQALIVFPHDKLRPMGRFAFDQKGRGAVTPVIEPYA